MQQHLQKASIEIRDFGYRNEKKEIKIQNDSTEIRHFFRYRRHLCIVRFCDTLVVLNLVLTRNPALVIWMVVIVVKLATLYAGLA